MLPIPLMKGSLGCLNTVSYPLGVSPSLWYNAAAPTASISTTGSNVINSSSKFSEWYDFGTKKLNLNIENTPSLLFYDYDQINGKQNGLTFFKESNPTTANTTYANNGYGIAGQGTIAIVFNYAKADTLLVDYSFFTRGANNAYGFLCSAYDKSFPYDDRKSYVTIFGDNQSYQFSNLLVNEWNIQIVSVNSVGNPVYYKTNGVTGATVSYTTEGSGLGAARTVFEQYNGSSIAEALFFETPLNATQCEDLENYLRQKWCLDF
jgi:hypothetical protein